MMSLLREAFHRILAHRRADHWKSRMRKGEDNKDMLKKMVQKKIMVPPLDIISTGKGKTKGVIGRRGKGER